jgi:hypothetical protein
VQALLRRIRPQALGRLHTVEQPGQRPAKAVPQGQFAIVEAHALAVQNNADQCVPVHANGHGHGVAAPAKLGLDAGAVGNDQGTLRRPLWLPAEGMHARILGL